jgi:hypothetical protein
VTRWLQTESVLSFEAIYTYTEVLTASLNKPRVDGDVSNSLCMHLKMKDVNRKASYSARETNNYEKHRH